MTSKKKVIVCLSLLALLGAAVVVAEIAPPSIPATHPIPVTPETDAAACFQCHISVDLPPANATAFCTVCHINIHIRFAANMPVVRPAPRPPHPVAMDWTSADCAFCHRLQHNGANATHQISTEMRNSAFCVTCHTSGLVKLTGEEKVGDFCARCHNLGVVPEHPSGEGKKAEFCLTCHKQEK